MNEDKIHSEKIKRTRKRNGTYFIDLISKKLCDKNLSSIARETAIPISVLHDWVKCKRVPSLSSIGYIKKIADLLGYSLEEVLISSGTMEKKTLNSTIICDEDRRFKVTIERIH
jgi:hypothetical protein